MHDGERKSARKGPTKEGPWNRASAKSDPGTGGRKAADQNAMFLGADLMILVGLFIVLGAMALSGCSVTGDVFIGSGHGGKL